MKKFIVLIILAVLVFFGYQKAKEYINIDDKVDKFIYADILDSIGEKKVDVSRYTIYGKHLNIEGMLPLDGEEFELVLKNNEKEVSIPIIKENNLFKTSKYINDGINLEKLEVGDYLFLLKDKINNTYYNLINKTEYHDNTYYTITKNFKNNLITFPELKYNENTYWKINVKEEKLPEEYYDIVIDPGHGGVDTGASNGKYHESKFNLEYGKMLYDALTEEGFKVKLSRDTDVMLEHYGEGSRSGIPYEVKAKLMLSLHLNSSNNKKISGVEIYRAYEDNDNFAKILADNIVNETSTNYSINPENKVMDGVYMRVYGKKTIDSLTRDAKKNGYEPYDIPNNTTYYYFIRETGGIMTKAFSDGRNPKYKANLYRNYNQGVEAYLCELGYISSNDNLKLIINEKEKYVKALTKSVLSYVNS